MPLIRTKALCERGHRLDGRHGPIMQTGPYLPTPPLVGAWHSSFLTLPPPKSCAQHSPNDLLQKPSTMGEKVSFRSKFIGPKRNNHHHCNCRNSNAKRTSNPTLSHRTHKAMAGGSLLLAELCVSTHWVSLEPVYPLEDFLQKELCR